MASQSLGTLTLDLIARVGGFETGMDKGQRAAEKWRKSVESSMKAASAATAAAAAAAAGAMGLWISRSIENATEIGRLAQIAGTGTREFQRFAAGARSVGVEQDKLSDILKDVNDKVGDFLVTGGGPLKDFFEQVAPRIGVTADQFRGLSGPQALGLYISTLEKAGANQQEMTFFMEALANDATALLPLMRDNGREMSRFGDEAERLGLVLSADAIQAAQDFATETDLLKQQLGAVGVEIGAGVLPYLNELVGALGQSISDTDIKGALDDIALAAEVAAVVIGGRLAGSAIKSAAYGLSSMVVLTKSATAGLTATATAARVASGALALIGGPVGAAAMAATAIGYFALRSSDAEKEAKALDGRIRELDGSLKSLTVNQAAAALLDYQTKLAEAENEAGAAAATVSRLNHNIKFTPRSPHIKEWERDLIKAKGTLDAKSQAVDVLKGKISDLNAIIEGTAPLDVAPQAASAAPGLGINLNAEDDLKAQNDELKEYYRLAGEVAAVVESSWSQQSQALNDYQKQVEKLREGVAAGLISEDQADQVTERLGEALDAQLEQIREAQAEAELENAGFWERWLAGAEESLTSFNEMAASVVENFSSQFGNAFESVILDAESAGDAFNQLAEAMIRSVVNATGQMLAQWAAYQVAQLLMSGTSNAAAVTQASATGAGIAAAYAPAAAAASLATAGGNSVPAIAGMSAASAFALGPLLGMAHEGIDKIPATGTWLLEKGERVTTANTSAKLDATLDRIQAGMANGQSAPTINVIEDASRAGRRDTREVDGRQIIDIFVANIRKDGAARKVLKQALGLRDAPK